MVAVVVVVYSLRKLKLQHFNRDGALKRFLTCLKLITALFCASAVPARASDRA